MPPTLVGIEAAVIHFLSSLATAFRFWLGKKKKKQFSISFFFFE